MAKVRSDKHGLYVKAGGYLFRPDGPTTVVAGSTVKARHVAYTPTGKVDQETWASHGDYSYWVGGPDTEGGHSKTIPSQYVHKSVTSTCPDCGMPRRQIGPNEFVPCRWWRRPEHACQVDAIVKSLTVSVEHNESIGRTTYHVLTRERARILAAAIKKHPEWGSEQAEYVLEKVGILR